MLTKPEKSFTEIGIEAIDKGLADPRLSAFYEAAMSSNPAQGYAPLKPFMPYLSLCSDKMVDHGPPPIFYVGGQSSQRTLFGDDWATPTGPSHALITPDLELERDSADGYRNALSGTPYYGYARTPVAIGGKRVEVAFERLIIALHPSPRSDYRICAYFGVIQDLRRTL